MLNFVGPLCLGLLLPGEVNPEATLMVAPATFHVVQVGMPWEDVEKLLGPPPHGRRGWYCAFNSETGWHCGTYGTGRWDCTFGTVTVRYHTGKVTEKSFTPNAKGVEALRMILRGTLQIRNALRRLEGPDFGFEPLKD